MSTVGGYLEYLGGCSVPWGDIMMHVGGYHEYRGGCSVPWGESVLLFEYPTVLMISPTCIMISPTVLKFQRMVSPHGTEHPHGTHDIPHVHHGTPHGTEHPPRYSR